MGTFQNSIHYCCVCKGGRNVYAYNGGNPEIENLAALCLERTPPYHRWYFQTMGRKTFGFLMDNDGSVYFAIADEGLGNVGVLRFLEHLGDEFNKVNKKGSKRNMSNVNSLCLQDQLVPVVHHLISSLQNVSRTGSDSEWPQETSLYHNGSELSPSPCNNGNGGTESRASTKAPLLGKSSKQERKKMKEQVIDTRDIELGEYQKSPESRAGIDLGSSCPRDQISSISPVQLQKDLGSARFRSNSQNIREKWCRQVRIVLIIDVVVCLVLFGIWLAICGGVGCMS